MKSKHVIFVLLLAFLLPAGCARQPAVRQAVPTPVKSEQLEERTTNWRHYQTKFRFKIDNKNTKLNARAVVLIGGQNLVRFETFGPLGQTAALYIANDSGPALFIPSEKLIFRARQPETLIRHFLGITLPFGVFRYGLAASIPPEQYKNLQSLSEGGILHLISQLGQNYFDWQFLPEGPSLSGVFIRSEGFEGRISYDPPVITDNQAIPRNIRIYSSEWNMEITIEEMNASPEFNPAVFSMPILPNVRVADLDMIQ